MRTNKNKILRRDFLKISLLAGTSLLSWKSFVACTAASPKINGTILKPTRNLGQIEKKGKSSLLPNADIYTAKEAGDGFLFNFPTGTLSGNKYITTDMLLDGTNVTNFCIELKEGETGPTFVFRFSALNQCGLRVRFPLDMVDMNRWGVDREGAFLKPRCSGDRVDLEKVDRMRFIVNRKSKKLSEFHITEFLATKEEVPLITDPILPKGCLLDELGQSNIHQWSNKTKTIEEMTSRLQKQLREAPDQKWPDTFSRWGGQANKKLTKGKGFFTTHHDGKRWWLVDPDGFAFWSTGLDCVRVDTEAMYNQLETALSFFPDKNGDYKSIYHENEFVQGQYKHINYLAANFIRTFGPNGWRDKWADVALSELRRMRFNTVGNWSEWEFAQKSKFPYVRPMEFSPIKVKAVYRDFPDVFDPNFTSDAAAYASILDETRDDPAMIGYFMMNEPQWGFSDELPAVGMMYNNPDSKTKTNLAQFLKEKYQTDQAISQAWEVQTSFNAIASGTWKSQFNKTALLDLESFSSIMVDKYFTILAEACRKADKNHLNLGIRYAGIPPEWVSKGMKSFDVFSINSYTKTVPKNITEYVNEKLGMPTIIGEWHFGALDVGLPFSGIGHLKNQTDRAKAYKIYVEDAAANPNCVGTHWFTLYDESAIGRFDGEAYNIGFLDICNKPYPELCQGAIQSHERIYDLANGVVTPFYEDIEYLPNLF